MLAERLFPGPFPLLKSLNSASDASASLTSRNRSDLPALSFIHLGVRNRGRIPTEPPSFPNSHTHIQSEAQWAALNQTSKDLLPLLRIPSQGPVRAWLLSPLWIRHGSRWEVEHFSSLWTIFVIVALQWCESRPTYIPWLKSLILFVRMNMCVLNPSLAL